MTKKRSGGARKYLLERLKELAGDGGRELWTTILNASELARAGNTVKAYENANKRKLRGLHDTGLPDGEPSLLLYLAHINKTVGSSSMSQVIAAFQMSEEAANLRWEDIEQKGDLLEVFVRRAKNDQKARGRRTFVEYQQGSDVGILLARWRVRISGRSIYVFPNLNNNKALSPSAIQSIAKSVLLKAGIDD
uniref:Uncharacterized protein n=1 Tax=Caenorhabditis japonica TaxID=281687 RepID=A0A8R1EE87_CAEJA